MASLHPSKDSRNLLIGPRSAGLQAFFSRVMTEHPRMDPHIEIQLLQRLAPSSLHSPHDLPIRAPTYATTGSTNSLTNLMRPIQERAILKTSIYEL